jgi:hypothetical protein
LASERVDNLLGVKVLLTVGVLLEQFSGTMAQEFVVRYLNFESARIPRIVQLEVIRVDERYLLVYDHSSSLLNTSHLEYLLGALAARMFYFKRESRNRIRKAGNH